MKFLHVTVQTVKFEEEIEFYQKEAGLTIQRDMRPVRDLVFLANAAGETCIEVIRNPEAGNSGNRNLSIGFRADDVEKKREDMIAAGYEVTPIISPSPDVKFFFVNDPAGLSVQFI